MESADELSQPTVVHAEPSPEPGDERRGTILDTPYDSVLVAAIKARWKHGQRYWDPDSETWWIQAGHEEACEDLVIEHFGGARVVYEDGSEKLRDLSGDYEQGGFFT